MRLLFIVPSLALILGCNGDREEDNGSAPANNVKEPANIGYTVVNVYPHDTASFTQGLEWHDGFLYEGTGLEGRSELKKISLQDGKTVQQLSIDRTLFGEGITILNDKIFQLTWQNNKVLVYDMATWKKTHEFAWPFQGWGITNNGKELIISTGTNNIYFVDPATFKILRTVSVNSNYGPIGDINELEFVNGKIYANIWGNDHIIIINPETGIVEGRLNLEGLLEKHSKRFENTDVLNGIAYDSTKNSFYLTGKRWPSLFEVKLNQ